MLTILPKHIQVLILILKTGIFKNERIDAHRSITIFYYLPNTTSQLRRFQYVQIGNGENILLDSIILLVLTEFRLDFR